MTCLQELKVMADRNRLEAECRVFTRYLADQLPDSYILKKYSDALLDKQPAAFQPQSAFDALLLKLAMIHPWMTRANDIYSRFFFSDSVLRKKLVLLLAILETREPTASHLDAPVRTSLIRFLLLFTGQAIIAGLLLVLSTLTLTPARLLMANKAPSRP